jgi:hypothetical protein
MSRACVCLVLTPSISYGIQVGNDADAEGKATYLLVIPSGAPVPEPRHPERSEGSPRVPYATTVILSEARDLHGCPHNGARVSHLQSVEIPRFARDDDGGKQEIRSLASLRMTMVVGWRPDPSLRSGRGIPPKWRSLFIEVHIPPAFFCS